MTGDSTMRKCMSRNGLMFDVDAKNFSIAVTSIEIDVMNGTAAEVWTKQGSFVGFETNMSNWTKIQGKFGYLTASKSMLFVDLTESSCSSLEFNRLYLEQHWLDNYPLESKRDHQCRLKAGFLSHHVNERYIH